MSNKNTTVAAVGVSFPVRQFDEKDLIYCGFMNPPRWTFSGSMVAACAPLFDDIESNYDVEEKLRKANVILKNNQTDTEYSALYVYFSKKQSGDKFIARLNAYLVLKAQKMATAAAY